MIWFTQAGFGSIWLNLVRAGRFGLTWLDHLKRFDLARSPQKVECQLFSILTYHGHSSWQVGIFKNIASTFRMLLRWWWSLNIIAHTYANSIGEDGFFEQVKTQYSTSMECVEKVTDIVAQTIRCLRLVITTLQFWTPEATISFYFTYNISSMSIETVSLREIERSP